MLYVRFKVIRVRRLKMNIERTDVGTGFWLAWILASAIGFGVGGAIGYAIMSVLNSTTVIVGLAFGAVFGAAGGTMQWLILRRQITGAGWWVLATSAAFALAGIAALVVSIDLGGNSLVAGIAFVAMSGVFGGSMQWLILRRQGVRAGQWPLATLLGLFLGFAMGFSVIVLSPTFNALVMALFGAGFGAGSGALTGAALIRMLRQSHSSDVEGMATAH
jgi:hypothetical protein